MGHASYRSLSKVSSVACFIASAFFLLATAVLALVTIVSPAMFPALVFFGILAAAGIYAGFDFREQYKVKGYAKREGKKPLE
jgi:hypothetical protein